MGRNTSQDNHKKIANNQESLSCESGSANAAHLIEEKKIIKEASEAGIRTSHITAAIEKEGHHQVSKALGMMSQWQTSSMNGDAAFGQALSHIKGGGNRLPEGNSNRIKLPTDDNLLWGYAKKHGLSDARPGEDFFQYRRRLQAEIRRRKAS